MSLLALKKVNFLDIAKIERAKKNKVYKKGSILLQVSASQGQLIYMNEDGVVDEKYAVITTDKINPRYLFHVLQKEMPQFLAIEQTGLNIKPEIMKKLNFEIHTNKETIEQIARIFEELDNAINLENKAVESLKDFKKWNLGKLFV